MTGSKKALALMNFANSYAVSARSSLFQGEINWVIAKSGFKPGNALFIPYACKGTDEATYVNDVAKEFAKAGIPLTDIKSGDPATLIAAAEAIVIGGGDYATLIAKLDSLKTPKFNPYVAIKNRVDARVPFFGWNEGSTIISPKYVTPAINSVADGINFSPFEIVCNFRDSQAVRGLIFNFLNTNPVVRKLITQPAEEFMPDGTSVRLEEAGGGMLESSTAPFPIVIRFEIVNGVLVAN